ncbi:hypothetical protein [Leptospira kanakyensis]|uniref:hypothetical protein n=1 Tax=Leptospira kanakyensis TaxID=2484968 RepID=UPI00223CFA26|nr:hypothetical protein [Leptospira kanakyensis]MCW7471794.1 hypothetical protein [Leptospira kanakyensis]MCW7483276.1 hypothetical protein [Leptospira kanakyensis]
MTAITTLITKDYIIFASDSIISEWNNKTNGYEYVEYTKPKIIPFKNLNCAAAYWGLAKTNTGWNTYDFLIELASKQNEFENIEHLASVITQELTKRLAEIPLTNILAKGIGIHLAGWETIGNEKIPELFLISNFSDPTYSSIRNLGYSRESFHTFFDVVPLLEHKESEYRKKVLNKLVEEERILIYNNGDPELFNSSANAIFKMIKSLKERKLLSGNDKERYIKITKLAIRFIKIIQNEFILGNRKLIGGRIHDLCIEKNNIFSSTTKIV